MRTNHYIVEVRDTANNDCIIFSRYFDGSEAQALAHFRKLPELRKMRRAGRSVYMRANPIALFEAF